MIQVVLVGATGSIGRSTLAVLRGLGPDARLLGVFAGSRAEPLARIASEWDVRYAGLASDEQLPALRTALPNVRTGAGAEILQEAIRDPDTDVVVSAAAGTAGLPASLEAVRQGKTLALANKESLVVLGPLLLAEARKTGARILPVDSEHSAIFQCLRAGRPGEVRRVVLTASGGPFRTWSREQMARATPADALRHPTWSMGPKITVDSATLMNKALEIVEARWLFDLRPEQIDVVVHPQSMVHSMVEFVDGSVVAQMGPPDMELPIQYALTYPERRKADRPGFRTEDFSALTFEDPDRERFPALGLGEQAARAGGTAGAVLNAANEVAVQRFLDGEIPFPAIADTVASVLEDTGLIADPTIEQIYEADRTAREDATRCRT
ncbi:MAG: 1-deoxy-D-xylulose-5-phosphate reductoisomerase [Planctomycetota bacterium]|nr:1-deoxy-D-xylulose-5-phosphate reductoisomerase [Planctomycetota bacterium]